MEWKVETSSTTGSQSESVYSEMPLLELAERIADTGDHRAIKELHDHRVLSFSRDRKALRLADYVAAMARRPLARQWCGHDDTILDRAYDLTVDKFVHVPVQRSDHQRSRRRGPDCRYYFRAFVRCAKARLIARPTANAIDAEMTATEILRKFVERHFHFSCWESKRRARKRVRRYLWNCDGHTLYLWLPLEISGRQCRQWLGANVPDIDPTRVGEQDRVQEIVNKLLARREILPIDRVGGGVAAIAAAIEPPPSWVQEQVTVDGLAETVAREKAENIMDQRPAIRHLGANQLKNLIHTIFAKLACDDYIEQTIAAHFGLSKSTLSRFAGSRWKTLWDDTIPDLWRNTAQTLAGHRTFVTAAQKAGVWKRVAQIADPDASQGNLTDD